MRIIVDNQITIENPTEEIRKVIEQDLKIQNPTWIKNNYLGMWNGKTPAFLYFYEIDGDNYIVPFGYFKRLYSMAKDAEWVNDIHTSETYMMSENIILYDYQREVATKIIEVKNGIVVMPAGSGKTLTALRTACAIGKKTLWITHTIDLLNQAYDNAKNNGITGLGKITNGKVEIGKHITFATVQTLSKLDLAKYKDTWGCIIVDECHRVCGTPASVTMFYKCISSLSARYLIGKDERRNELILERLEQDKEHYCLVLGDRVEHLESLQQALGLGVVIHGKTPKKQREANLQDIKMGYTHFLFATYALAKEGLDIPRLDRLFLVSPRDDKAVIVQSVGRIERCFEGKGQPIVYDFVDTGEYFEKKFKKRKTIYKKNGNEVIDYVK